MAKLNAVKANESTGPETINIGDRAIDNLAFIRDTMERSTSFTAVPGYGGILMGATAIAAAYIATIQPGLRESIVTWLAEAALAFAIGVLAMWQKSKIAGQSLASAPAKKFAMSFAPPLIVGVVVTLGLAASRVFLRSAAGLYVGVWCGGRLRRCVLGPRRAGDGLVLYGARGGRIHIADQLRKPDDGGELRPAAHRFRSDHREALRRIVWR